MKFWLPLTILLTMISPNLEADYIDPRQALVEQPYLLELQLFNVNFARYIWTADVTVEDYDPVTEIIEGEIDWKANGKFFASRDFRGRVTDSGSYTSVQVFPDWGTVWQGQFSEDFLSASGRMDGLGTSDMVGSWTLTAIDLPPAGILFIGALGTLVILKPRRETPIN